jgi:signal transduction histidine kinase
MKVLLTAFFTAFLFPIALAQREELKDTARFKDELSKATRDTTRTLLMAEIAEAYRAAFPDSALFYGQRALSLATQINFPKGQVVGLLSISVIQRELGNYSIALDDGIKALLIARTNNLLHEIPICMVRIGNVYLYSENYKEALKYYIWSEEALKVAPDDFYQQVIWLFLSASYVELNKLDSAFEFIHLAEKSSSINNLSPLYFRILGRIQYKSGNNQLALDSYRQGIQYALAHRELRTGSTLFISAAAIYKNMGLIDSSIYCAKQGFLYGQDLAFRRQILDASVSLADLYEEKKDISQSLYYHKIASAAKDSMYSSQKMYAMQSVIMNELERQLESEAAKTAYQNKVRQLALTAGLLVFLIIATILYRNIVYKQKANTLLKKQKQEIQDTLTELKATQVQLIQSEKMASLGELTSGIAHEIQNPLNFVNNFSEVSNELIEEQNQELSNGNIERAKAIGQDIKQNLERIAHHGQRADGIVKGMLQHSRSGKGEKQLTAINAIVEECLKLSYHNQRAKVQTFEVQITTAFDPAVEAIQVVPQDLIRVFVNLFNNAFYAVAEKKKTQVNEYKPAVSVATRQADGLLRITVKDNGDGIPAGIKDKIFQPFFTTKPTGQGTGLGLSLAYDIVKAHGGEIIVESREGEGAEFTVLLPV